MTDNYTLLLSLSLLLYMVCMVSTNEFKRGRKLEVSLEKLIHEFLLEDYVKDIRPEPSHATPLDVHFDMKLKKIVALNVKDQILKINAFTMMQWEDPGLSWNASEFEDIKNINMGSNLIWTPDVVLYNTGEETSLAHTDMYKTKALVTHTGKVIWTAPVTWKVQCSFDVTWFPIDKQVCNLTFGSSTYHSDQIELSFWSVPSSIEDFIHGKFMIKSGEWEIVSVRSWEFDVKYPCCPDSYSTITYEVDFERMSLYYFLYIILPLVSQVFLFLLIFHIPYDSGERMGFGVTILLSITVYLLVISEKLPEKSDDKPMLGICFILEFYILSTGLVAAAVTVLIARRTNRPSDVVVKIANFCNNKGDAIRRRDKPYKLNKPDIRNDTNGGCHPDDEECKNVCLADPSNNEENYGEEWAKICRALDRIFFYAFTICVFIIPIIVCSSLDRKNLGM